MDGIGQKDSEAWGLLNIVDKQYNIVAKSQDWTSKPGYVLSKKGHNSNHTKTIGISWDYPGEIGIVGKLEHIVPCRDHFEARRPDCKFHPQFANSVVSASSIKSVSLYSSVMWGWWLCLLMDYREDQKRYYLQSTWNHTWHMAHDQ